MSRFDRIHLVVGMLSLGWLVLGTASSAYTAEECYMHGGETVEDYIQCLKPVARYRGIGPEEAEKPAAVSTPMILFEFDSDRLTPTAKDGLDKLGAALASSELSQFRYIVEGHTDASGGEEYNLDLSRRRAKAVKDYLVTMYRIDPDRLEPVGKGKSELYLPAFPYAAENRRVRVAHTDW